MKLILHILCSVEMILKVNSWFKYCIFRFSSQKYHGHYVWQILCQCIFHCSTGVCGK